jgi:hypothetical protein
VTEAFYALDSNYLYLRLETVDPAGWPSASPSGEARYKWFIDLNSDAYRSGGSIYDAEYELIVEDLTVFPDPTIGRNLLGEITLMDDLANVGFTTRWDSNTPPRYTTNGPSSPQWRRALGAGVAGTGGPQAVETDPDIGYRISGNFVDMYVSRSAIGSPSAIGVFWATEPHNNNLDQSPNCDRMDIDFYVITDPTPTPTSTATVTGTPPTPSPSPTVTATATATRPTRTPTPGEPTATPTTRPIPTSPGGGFVGGESLGSLAPLASRAGVDSKPSAPLRSAFLALAAALLAAIAYAGAVKRG